MAGIPDVNVAALHRVPPENGGEFRIMTVFAVSMLQISACPQHGCCFIPSCGFKACFSVSMCRAFSLPGVCSVPDAIRFIGINSLSEIRPISMGVSAFRTDLFRLSDLHLNEKTEG